MRTITTYRLTLQLSTVAFGLLPSASSAQAWSTAGIPIPTDQMTCIYADTIADALYFCALTDLNGDSNANDQAISVLTSGQWDTLGVFSNEPRCIVRWNDTLLVGGGFDYVNGQSISRIAAYANGNWSSYGVFSWGGSAGLVDRFRIIDGELFALGAFKFADGYLCNSIAKRQGNEWVNVGFMDMDDPGGIHDLVKFNGELIASGTFDIVGEGNAIARFDGSEWHTLGPGIIGSFGGSGRSMAVYQGELYLSGAIDGDVNPGHGIMRWDGAQFLPVGTGFQDINGQQNYLIGALDMKVRDGLLWASGTFSYAGNQPTPGIAVWDGSSWCALPLGPTPEINAFEFFHDTLFTSNHAFLFGQPYVPAVRFNGDINGADICSWSVGISEARPTETPRVWVDPAGMLQLMGFRPGKADLVVRDAVGRVVFVQNEVIDSAGLASIPFGAVATGFYVLCVSGQTPVPFMAGR